MQKNRLDALKEAEDKNFDCAIFDDGLQDKNINYDISIVCFSNSQWIGNGFLIPAGPLRENIASIKKYDAIVLNGKPSLNSKIIDGALVGGASLDVDKFVTIINSIDL